MRAAVIGCGFQGRLHLSTLTALEGVEVIAVCDASPERAAAVAAEFSIAHRYTDYRELLDNHELDVVTVCTMPNTHREITIAALGRSCHVLCEKPMAMNATEAAEMASEAKRNGVELGVGFNMRFNESAKAIRGFLDSGELGRPICARGHMLADDVPWWGRHYDHAVSGGGALAATAVHMLDLVRWLVGNPLPVTATASMTTLFPGKRGGGAPSDEARAAYSVEDLFFGHVRFDDGFWMSIEGAWVWDQPGWNYGFDLVGDRAQARYEPLELWGEAEGAPARLQAPADVSNDFPGSVAREVETFVRSLESRASTDVATARDGVVVQALVDALYESAAAGREVAVEIPEP
ncbi:MAG: Gfo/Idh/MocA family protein [Gaiellaceae bacterium]